MEKQVTIYQIAEECGVAVSTVSRVLNGGEHVSKKTMDKVTRVIEKYNFSPNALARAMSNRKTGTIGVLMPDITNPYFSALFLEIERYALIREYSVILYNTLHGGASHGVKSPFDEIRYLKMMKEKMVDGVIVTGGPIDLEDTPKEYIKALNDLNRSIPVVIIGQEAEGCDCLFVNRNLGGGVASLVQHLAALGNQRIGFVGGEVGVRQTRERLKAYRNTLESIGMKVDEGLIALSDYYAADGYDAMKKLLQKEKLPQAVIAINDRVALGAIRAISDSGRRVPEDIAVVSCDQFYDSEFYVPRLTTLDQQNDYIGRLAIQLLMGAINGSGESIDVRHTPQMIVRESCGSGLGIREEHKKDIRYERRKNKIMETLP